MDLWPDLPAAVRASIMAAAVRAGVPSVLLAQVLCQVDFAKVLMRRGLAAGALDIRTVTAAELGRAIVLAVHDERLHAAAADWRERVRTERGLAAAADLEHSSGW